MKEGRKKGDEEEKKGSEGWSKHNYTLTKVL